ncbi:unnamed protein product [Agarophyton chilense]|eukprot:gb/GEZJ01000063.1/.p1 GENE.gb/GEZJ01000063.1/~~gb/GEZJ01000063.1/.p1  ORF type:complete len:743 (-),score=98.43 gb/GEZJ01000063.1/:451-2679(-)
MLQARTNTACRLPHPAATPTPGVHPSQLRLTSTQLGRGSSAAVYLGFLAGCPVAVKRCSLVSTNTSAFIQFRRELSRYHHLRHPCITQFFDVVQRHDDLLLVTELMRGGSLFHALSDLRHAGVHALSHESLLRIAQHVANGLSYLHASHFSFGDLKSMNVLLSEKPNTSAASFPPDAQAKLCDFGLSRNLNHLSDPNVDNAASHLHHTHSPAQKGPAGTYAYLAPEAFNGLPADDPHAPKAADIYALAIVLWELATLQKPWPGRKPLQLIHLVAKQRMRPPWPKNHRLPPGYVHLVESCWHHDAQRRPTVDQVCAELHRMYEQLALQAPSLPLSPASESEQCVQHDKPPVCDLDDLSEFGAVHVDDGLREHVCRDQSQKAHHLEPGVMKPSLATIKQVQSMRLSAEEVLSICENMSEIASEVTQASDQNSQHTLRTNISSFDSNNHERSQHRVNEHRLMHINRYNNDHVTHYDRPDVDEKLQSVFAPPRPERHDFASGGDAPQQATEHIWMEPTVATIQQVQSMRLSKEEVMSMCDNTTELATEAAHTSDHDRHHYLPANSSSDDSWKSQNVRKSPMGKEHDVVAGDLSEHVWTECAPAPISHLRSTQLSSEERMSVNKNAYELAPKSTPPMSHKVNDNLRTCMTSAVSNSHARARCRASNGDVIGNDYSGNHHGVHYASSSISGRMQTVGAYDLRRRYGLPAEVVDEQVIEEELEALEHEESQSIEQLGISLEPRSRFRYL